ncbi:hypothetical protein HII31_06682 [Pseudocercospora fuligena]|uniref:Uncharacterized protein n=1 Tax=Pseudocercospora fuligena TaxID=685502 RepID=A0A8H6RK44_9PEZI|nr:hypothetical protein HII31_06682 [Pseudocercospora fuligena]
MTYAKKCALPLDIVLESVINTKNERTIDSLQQQALNIVGGFSFGRADEMPFSFQDRYAEFIKHVAISIDLRISVA